MRAMLVWLRPLALVLALAALILLALSGPGVRFGLWSFGTGFVLFRWTAYIAIATEPVPGHSIAFRDLAVTQGALDNALIAAKALALTALDVLTDPTVLQRARTEFEERRKVGIVKGRAS